MNIRILFNNSNSSENNGSSDSRDDRSERDAGSVQSGSHTGEEDIISQFSGFEPMDFRGERPHRSDGEDDEEIDVLGR